MGEPGPLDERITRAVAEDLAHQYGSAVDSHDLHVALRASKVAAAELGSWMCDNPAFGHLGEESQASYIGRMLKRMFK